LRRSSQQQQENKKDRGIALKIIEEDSSELDEEDMAMITRKSKKFFKKTKEGARRKHPSKFKNSDREQLIGCFKCGKMDHIVKNCPQQKEDQEAEPPKKQFRKQGGNSSGKRFTRAMLATWGIPLMKKKGQKKKRKS